MPISQLGQINTTALSVADIYVQIVPPQFLINGVPSNILGLVGTAAWGPVNTPTVIGSPTQYAQTFGPYAARTYDMGTHATIAFQQGATILKCVRATDGTDVAASCAITISSTVQITFTARWTGSYGNNLKATIGPGSATGTHRVVISAPGQFPESFDNITGSGNTKWINIANAINNGQSQQRGPSQFVTASAGSGSASPQAGVNAFASGTDGAGVTYTNLHGTDTQPRTGMYALRNQGCSVAILCDVVNTASWTTQVSFGASEGVYMIMADAAGTSVSTTIADKASAGIDNFTAKLMCGDWVYWGDTLNNLPNRLVSPQPFVGGLLANLAPSQSSLNKQLYGVIATQQTLTGSPYTNADLQSLADAGVDVITKPAPGGNYFAARNGRNTSSNAVVHGDNYTRMTYYIAQTLNRAMGYYVGFLQSSHPDDPTRRQAKITLDAYLDALAAPVAIGQEPLIDDYMVTLDLTNNPPNRIALGYMQADVQVRYLSVVEFFIVNLEGGQSVIINRGAVAPVQ